MHAALRLANRDRPVAAVRPPASEPRVTQDTSPETNLAELIAEAQQGNIAAFERLMAMYQGKILSFARAFVSDPEHASDVAQDAMLRIYRSLGGFRFQSSLQTWMFRIVRNIVLDHAKSRRSKERKREQSLDGTPEREIGESGDRSPEAQLLAHERKSQLWSALSEIPEAYRSVLVLADLQGMSYEEVAAIVDTPVGTVKSRLNRGREALRVVLLEKSCLFEGRRS
jgi:RNA polymerase sigma-70 factor (ECF subfamily)